MNHDAFQRIGPRAFWALLALGAALAAAGLFAAHTMEGGRHVFYRSADSMLAVVLCLFLVSPALAFDTQHG